METKGNAPEGQKGGNNKIWMILLALSVIFNIYQWQNKVTVVETMQMTTDSLATSKADVDKQLAETYEELNQYKGINARLDSLLAVANGDIEAKQARIEKLMKNEKNSKELNKKLQAELEELKKLRDEYLEKIDQLLVENQQLKKDKEDLTSTVENLSKNLESTINVASVLKSEYINVKTYKKKGSDKFVETAMAKRTNKMEVCFSVIENKIAKSGSRNVYLRIVEPGGKTMGARSEGSSTFKMAGSGEEVQFTSTASIDYQNAKMDQCLNWEEQERIFAPGTYVVEIYIDGQLSGASSYVLK
jgi:DNA repair ATPase RecN